MLSLKPYDKYKETEISWLGEIPEHWELRPLRTVLKQRNEQNKHARIDQILSLSIAHGVTLYSHEKRGGNKRKSDLTAYKIAYPGDIVLNSMNVIVGAVGLSKYKGAISPVYYALYPISKKVEITYYEKIFKNTPFQGYLRIYGKGILIKKSSTGKLNTIRMKISPDDLKCTVLPIPPQSEQQQIARYLDWKTSQINKFIKAKKKLITLLKEQKQIIINEAVTKGINPDVKMKDSGVEWLGNIPEHWEVRKLKFLATKFGSGVTPKGGASVYKKIGIPFLRSQNIHFDGLKLDNVVFISDFIHQNKMKSSQVFPNDVLLNITGASIGRTCFIPKDFSDANVNQHVCIIRPKIGIINPKYLSSYLSTSLAQRCIIEQQNGSSREGLTLFSIKEFYIVFPSLKSQNLILKHIEKETSTINKTIVRTEREIELIQEYRTRLISDVVTGKVDARSIEIPDYEAVEKDYDIQEKSEAEECLIEGSEE